MEGVSSADVLCEEKHAEAHSLSFPGLGVYKARTGSTVPLH